MDTKGMWAVKSSKTVLSVKTQQQIRLEKEFLHQKRAYAFLCRSRDVVFSLLAIIVLSPLMLLVALLIVMDDPHGSPIFSQYRVGKNGEPFKLYKFRSMIVNAEGKLDMLLKQNEMDGPVFKMKKDPRITRIGKLIRKTSIDELPQLFNILRGEMSIVGPIPSLPREVKMYNAYQMQRLYVTPGLTCYWQIQPKRNSLTFDEWVALDIQYIQDRTFWLDWKIILKTIGVVFTCQGE